MIRSNRPRSHLLWPTASLVLSALYACGAGAQAADAPDLRSFETLYADLVDDGGIVATIDSGLFTVYQGKDLDWWLHRYREQRRELLGQLAGIPESTLSDADAPALRLMRERLQSILPEDPHRAAHAISPPSGDCSQAPRRDLSARALRDDLYACFASIGNNLQFEGKTLSRDSAIALLGQINEPERRKALFLAFEPLWEAVNGKDESDSPYRRRLRAAALDAGEHGSALDAAGRDLGIKPDEVELWLTRILETWRDVTPATPVEPWDYRYLAGAADRSLAPVITTANLVPVVKSYYRDLGADLDALGVRFDLASRPGKAPITYANYITMGHDVHGRWQPGESRISASFSQGGLYVLNMLTHESAHAAHFGAIRTRPAFMDLGDELFCESFADVTSWNVYDPVWQRKYLGRSVSTQDGLRSLYTVVTLESAWALFELRMLRDPDADPNRVWSDIAHQYFHIIAHPEYSWWALRVQLVTKPGFMANYGLGAAVTADVRQHIRESLGPFNAGDARWYAWVSQHLLSSGLQFDTPTLLTRFLGRPVSLEPLLDDMRRIKPGTPSRN